MDAIADLLVRIKNALRTREESVDIPHSKIREGIARILLEEGFIAKGDTFVRMKKKFLRIGLKYSPEKKSVIENLKRISTPGRRVYVNSKKVPWVQGGYGIAIISTTKGLMTDVSAREKKLGGEVLCYVW